MKSRCAALGFALLALACASKSVPDDNGGRSGPVQSRLKAQTTVTMTATETGTATTTAIETGTVTATATQTVTFTGTRTGTGPGIHQQIYTFTGTVTATSTGIVYYASWPHSQGNTATATTNQFASGTAMTTVTRTVTSPFGGTATKTASATVTGSGTKTGTATLTVTATVTTGTTNAGTGTGTVTATGTATGTATQTWTATWTTQVTETVTNTGTSTVTNTNTVSNTATLTNTVTTTVTQTMTGMDTSVDAGTSDGGAGSCLENWRNTTCGQSCTQETQEDRMHCTDFLDCYFQNGVGPTDDPDGTCGVNQFNYGMAPKTIADQVYQCLGCLGSSPVTSCAGVPDNTPCTDNNACTTGEMCVHGKCVPDAPSISRCLYESAPKNPWGRTRRRYAAYLAAQLRTPEAVQMLQRVALSSDSEFSAVGENTELPSRIRAAFGLAHCLVDGVQQSDVSMMQVLRSAEVEVARMAALELFSRGRLGDEHRAVLATRGIPSNFRRYTQEEVAQLRHVKRSQ